MGPVARACKAGVDVRHARIRLELQPRAPHDGVHDHRKAVRLGRAAQITHAQNQCLNACYICLGRAGRDGRTSMGLPEPGRRTPTNAPSEE